MLTFDQLVTETTTLITEIMPWDLSELLNKTTTLLLLDVREPDEFKTLHIEHSINVPRGILEPAAEFGYDETEPILVNARDQQIIVVCRSGRRSCLAAHTLQQSGFKRVISLKTGLRGWNDYDQPLVNEENLQVDGDLAEEYLKPKS